jgi:hypothetical protein
MRYQAMNDKVIDWTLILILSLTAYFGQCLVLYQPRVIKGRVANGMIRSRKRQRGKGKMVVRKQTPVPTEDKEGYEGDRINSRAGWWVNRGRNVERKEQDVLAPHALHWAAITAGVKGHTWEEQTMACTRDGHGTVSTDWQNEQMAWDTTTWPPSIGRAGFYVSTVGDSEGIQVTTIV